MHDLAFGMAANNAAEPPVTQVGNYQRSSLFAVVNELFSPRTAWFFVGGSAFYHPVWHPRCLPGGMAKQHVHVQEGKQHKESASG